MKNFIWLITAANIHKFETKNKISLKNENLFINSRFFLFSCSNPEEKIPKNILSQTAFETILKEVHLAQATFELNKAKEMESAKKELANSYFDIYKKYLISEEVFKENLNYYSENPEKLGHIYTNVLEQLTTERSTLDQQ